MPEYEAVIGLEVHAQLKTDSKLFCSCSTAYGQEPNSNTCPVCTGMPGALPVLNKKAVEYAVKMALAVACKINQKSVFARKNYFYPDLPKGYQISQYEEPLAEFGHLEITTPETTKQVGIIRIHMEDDAGKSMHVSGENISYVDLNRTGVPLIEIVSAPEIYSPDEAVAYLKSLRNILVYLDICEGNMQEGNFRCDANISIRRKGDTQFGTRTEVKNMNSFRFVHKALQYEIQRQEDLLQDGEVVLQETRLFDENLGKTRSMRGKEEAHDYRYFPDPDLVPIHIGQEEIQKWQDELPELPVARFKRFLSDYGLPEYDAGVLTGDRELADYFEQVAAVYEHYKTLSNWMMSEMLREIKEQGISPGGSGFTPKKFASLLNMIDQGKINTKIGKQIFPELFQKGYPPEEYVQEKGLLQISDQSELEQIVQEVIRENPEEVKAYQGGKKKLLSFFMGQVMKKTKGQADPKTVNALLSKELQQT